MWRKRVLKRMKIFYHRIIRAFSIFLISRQTLSSWHNRNLNCFNISINSRDHHTDTRTLMCVTTGTEKPCRFTTIITSDHRDHSTLRTVPAVQKEQQQFIIIKRCFFFLLLAVVVGNCERMHVFLRGDKCCIIVYLIICDIRCYRFKTL